MRIPLAIWLALLSIPLSIGVALWKGGADRRTGAAVMGAVAIVFAAVFYLTST